MWVSATCRQSSGFRRHPKQESGTIRMLGLINGCRQVNGTGSALGAGLPCLFRLGTPHGDQSCWRLDEPSVASESLIVGARRISDTVNSVRLLRVCSVRNESGDFSEVLIRSSFYEISFFGP